MAVRKLSQSWVDKYVPERTPFEVRDKGDAPAVAGLILRFQPSGRKYYYAGFRKTVIDPDTKERRRKQTRKQIGRADHVSLTEAREKARKILQAARDAVSFPASDTG